ncbi:MAG: hypothetical protein QXZ28_04030 [Candidatus Methanomethylicaceae archaeon]
MGDSGAEGVFRSRALCRLSDRWATHCPPSCHSDSGAVPPTPTAAFAVASAGYRAPGTVDE